MEAEEGRAFSHPWPCLGSQCPLVAPGQHRHGPDPKGRPGGGALAPTHAAPSLGVRLGGLQHGQKHSTGSDPPAWGGSPWLSRSVLVTFSPLCPHLG